MIPKSTKPARIAENLDVFDFELTQHQITAIDDLDTGVRGGPEPDSITLRTTVRDSRSLRLSLTFAARILGRTREK